MNRIYKVVWNQALHCFTAVSEYAKGRGKSSTSSVSANATINPTNHLSIIKTLRLSTIALGLLAAGFGMPANSEVSYSNTMYITGHQSHGNGNGNGHESHGNGNGYGHNHNGNSSNDILKFDGDTGRTVVRKHGQTLTIEGGEDNRRKLANGKNIGVVADGRDTLTIKLAKNLTDLDSVTFNGGVVISSVGINAGNKTISGVADGVAGNDAVNLNQLTDTVAANKTKYYSVKSTASGNANNDGATGSNAMAMGGNASATGGQAIAIGSGQSGQNTVASGQQSIAIGANVVSKGHSSIAIGGDDLDDASKANIDGTSASTLNGGDVNTTFFSYTGRDLVETPRYKVNTESGGAASIAIGAKSLSEGALSTAVGVQSSSSGDASSAFGIGASASEKGSVALGAGSVANVAGGVAGYVPTGVSTADAMAITNTQSGTNSGAVSVGSSIEGGTRQIVNVAAGKNDSDAVNVSQLKALDTMVAGIDFPIRSSNAQPYTTSVVGTDALAVGSNAEANGNNSTAVGENTKAIGIQASAFGSGAEATARSSLASGFEAKAIGVESVALGVKSNAEGLGATAVGPTARARGENSTALGRRSKADSNGTLALGGFSKAVGENASAVGVNAEATKKNATAVGVNAKAEGERSVALGEGAQATTLTGTAIGSRTLASAVQSTAVGVGSKATKQWATSMGFSSQANGVSSVALGDRSEVSGKESIAIGKGNTVTGSNSIAIGTGHTVVGDNSGAFGDPNNITGSGSYVIGNDNTVANNNTFVLGNGVETTQDNSVVLGNLSTDRAATMETGVTISGTPYTYAGSAPIGVTSVGFVGGERQIINVAAGAVNATSTDAINGSQLYATNEAVDSNTTTINKGFALKAADGNTVQKPLGQAVEVVGSNDNIDTRVKNGKIEVKLNNDLDLGSNGSVEMGSSFPGGFGRTTTLDRSGLTTGNSYVSTTVDGLGVRTGSVLASTSVNGLGVFVNGPLGVPKTVLNVDGLTIIGGPSVTRSGGINAGNKKIVNVDNGEDPNDAVNVSQLNSSSASAKTKVVAGTNVASVVKSTGGNGQDVYTVNADGVTASAGSTAVEVSSTTVANNLTDYTVDLSQGTKDSLIRADNSVQYDNLAKTSVTLGGMGSTIPVTLTNVAAGNISEDSTDAVNGSQLFETNTKVSQGFGLKAADGQTVMKQLGEQVEVVGSNSNIDTRVKNGKIEVKLNNDLDLGSNGSVEMGSSSPFGFGSTTTLDRSGLTTGSVLASTSVNGLGVFVNGPLGIPKTVLSMDGLTIIGGPSVTKSGGINAGNKKVTNVKAGVLDEDAVNVSQLNSASAAAKTEVAAGTNVADVVKSTGDNGQDIYTVNADGVTASAGSTAVTVTAGEKDETTNTTDYAVDLSADSKASLVKADSAMQTIVAQIDGVDVKTLNKTDNTANFLTGDNIVLSAEDGGIKIATKEDVTFTSASFANSTVRVSGEGLDNGGNRIVNVDDGQGDTDAVNVRQLNATNNTVDLGLNFTGDDTTVVVNRKLGQTLTLQGGATELTENNIGVIADEEGNLNVRLAEDVMLGKNGSVRMESTVLNNAGVTITDGPNQTITLSNEGLDNGNNRIIKVGEGIAPTDAVNFAQLTTTNNEIAKGIKIGDGNSANDQQFALGDTINVTGDSNLTTVASATGVQVKLNNQLDLGDDGSLQIGNSIMNNTGFTFIDSGQGRTVTLSSRGLDNGGNPISNVGAGELNTDAVNVGQLKEIAIALDQGWGITAQGDIATMVKQGDAVDLNSKDGNIKVSRTSFSDAVALDGNPSIQASAIPINANDISFDLNPDIALDSVTTGDTTINDNGLTIVGGPSITKSGIDAANNKVTNVQNGEVSATSQDAVNGGQLYAQGSGISSIIGGDTVYNAESGTFTNSNIGGTGESNIDGAIASIRQGTIEINENVQVNTNNITTNTSNIASNSANIATNTSNITTNTTNIQSNTEKLDAGLNFGADSGDDINKPIGDSSVLSFTGGSNITTTAEGSSIKFDLNGNISVDSVTAGTTVINSNGISMQDGPSMTAQGLYAGNQRMTGVADGVEATDAVNYSQLSALDSRLNSNMSDLGYKIDEVEDDANAGISAAMAMAALPQAYISGKSLIGGGISTYNGESAVAIGVSKLSNDGRWVIKVNGTADTQGNVGGAIGAGFHFD